MSDQLGQGSIHEFGAAFLSSLQQAAAQASAEPPSVVRSLREHFATDLKGLPIVTESFDAHDHPNVQASLDRWLAGDGRSAELLGVSSDAHWMEITFCSTRWTGCTTTRTCCSC